MHQVDRHVQGDRRPSYERAWSTTHRIISWVGGIALVPTILFLLTLVSGSHYDQGHWKHALATLAAAFAVFASLLQAAKAAEKSAYHAARGRTGTADDPTEMQHFRAVAIAWIVVFGGALLSLAAEIVDFSLP